jgi:hypothetical protein
MEFKEQILYCIENFDFDAIISYLEDINGKPLNEPASAEMLKTVASSMLEDVALNGGYRESHSIFAERKGEFLELSFIPQRINALNKLFNS